MAIKRNKESPSGQPKDPTKPPKIVINDPAAESPAPPPPPEPPSIKPPTDGGSGSGGGSSSGGGGASKKGKAEKKGNPIAEAQQFLHEVIIEFRKITWPEKSQVLRETWSVLFLVAVITLMVLGFDWVLGNLVFGPLEHFARLHGGGIGAR
ncbi:MAG: preprotein translocase subunit SecE [Candidatus Obscuribacterales bacterium]|nr:preprotein translocase subunit SecE [Cyanobacteria bacterium SZAS LIN-5]RTL37975.1 MAG: preprotein translocase subunit SecE [Candidatus Melainabacteria bacterium]